MKDICRVTQEVVRHNASAESYLLDLFPSVAIQQRNTANSFRHPTRIPQTVIHSPTRRMHHPFVKMHALFKLSTSQCTKCEQ